MTYKRRGLLVEASKQKLRKDEYDDSEPESTEGNNYSYYRHFYYNVNTRLY